MLEAACHNIATWYAALPAVDLWLAEPRKEGRIPPQARPSSSVFLDLSSKPRFRAI